VTTFEFEVYVDGNVIYPNGYVFVTPQPVALEPLQLVQLSAGVFDVVSRPVAGSVTWSTLDGTIATVDGTGLVQAIAPGVVDIVASNGGPQADGASRVTVLGSGFDIELRLWPGAPTPSQAVQNAFANAKARWQQLITGDLSDITIQHQPVGCAPLLSEVVDDLLIYMLVGPIDGPGGILGQASPCYIRSLPGFLPVTGIMEFDQDDLAALQTSGQLEQVILHEMGHVLGIGVLWDYVGLLEPPGCDDQTPDPYFTGSDALAAFNAAGGTAYTGNKIPVENTGGEGTVCAHWRESVLDNELLTGFLNSGTNPLSAITVESLGDMGYTVDASTADAYVLPSPPPGPAALRTGRLALHNDIRPGPLYVVDTQGRVTAVPRPLLRR
jgi:hypothetical protein